MVTDRYERELVRKVEETEKEKKIEKLLKRQKKLVQDSVNHEVRKLEKERLNRIAEDRRKEDFRSYLESKHNNAKFMDQQNARTA